MPKKIGKDVVEKKSSGIIATPKEHKEFEEWKEEQKQEKKAEEAEEIEGKQIKYAMPMEKEPSEDQILEERAKIYEEMAKLKASKVVPKEE
ncbi:MAG: hypothetical protein QXJ31_05485 [Candidatus Bathyarchaeia archaeon]